MVERKLTPLKNQASGEHTVHEDDFECTVDRCFTDAVIKAGGGFVIGSLCSLLFLRRRTWPILMGIGFGLGSAYQACEKHMKLLTSDPHRSDPAGNATKMKSK